MKLQTFAFALLASSSLFACDALSDKIGDVLPDVTLGAKDGIPPVAGSTSVALPTGFKCGDPIMDPNMKYTIKTEVTGENCTFTFSQEVTALQAKDYAGHPELKGAQLLRQVDMNVTKLAITDENSKPVQPQDLNGTAFGATILTLKDLGQPLPFTKTIEGAPLEKVKDLVANQQDIIIPVTVVIVVPVATIPATINLDYDAQPNLVFGF